MYQPFGCVHAVVQGEVPCGNGQFRSLFVGGDLIAFFLWLSRGLLVALIYPWGRVDCICNSKTSRSVSVSVILLETNL